jgi:hypothetical protein
MLKELKEEIKDIKKEDIKKDTKKENKKKTKKEEKKDAPFVIKRKGKTYYIEDSDDLQSIF